MQKRRLGRSDLYLTPLGLGTWAIGGPWAYGWGPQDDAESVATIGRALELGRPTASGMRRRWSGRRSAVGAMKS